MKSQRGNDLPQSVPRDGRNPVTPEHGILLCSLLGPVHCAVRRRATIWANASTDAHSAPSGGAG